MRQILKVLLFVCVLSVPAVVEVNIFESSRNVFSGHPIYKPNFWAVFRFGNPWWCLEFRLAYPLSFETVRWPLLPTEAHFR